MRIRVDGQAYTGFTDLEVSRHFLNASGQFVFKASPLNVQTSPYPLQVGQSVEITVADEIFLNGYIDTINTYTSSNKVMIVIEGRDKTEDLIDSTIDATIFPTYVGTVSFTTVCRTVLDKLGMTDIGVTDTVGVTFQQGEYIAPNTAENAFEFLERYARKGQVILTTDGLGNLLITRGGTTKLPTQLLLTTSGIDNNIVRGNMNASIAKRYNKYRLYTQNFNLFGQINANAASLNDAITNSKAEAFDSEIRSTRQYVFQPESPLDIQSCSARATWEANYRKTQGYSYNCTVSEHTYADRFIWPLNTQVQVIDEYAGLNSFLLIDSLSFHESATQGRTTDITLVPPNAYTLNIQQDYRRSQAEDRSNAYYRSN